MERGLGERENVEERESHFISTTRKIKFFDFFSKMHQEVQSVNQSSRCNLNFLKIKKWISSSSDAIIFPLFGLEMMILIEFLDK